MNIHQSIKSLNVILLILGLGVSPMLAQDNMKEQLVVPLSNPGKPGVLEVGLVNGSIRVTGHSGKEVVIDAVPGPRRGKRNEADERPGPDGMKRISGGNSLEISAREQNNTIRIETDSWQRALDLTIKVPQQFSLKLRATNQGDVTVDNVSGEMEVTNVNGAIRLTNVSGSAVANTINGDLVVTFKEITPNTPMAFSSLNGKVDVTFPASTKALVKLKSEMGEIYSDFDLALEKRQPKVDRTSQSGMYKVSLEDWTYGKINGGGPEILMKNMMGNIYLRKIK